MKKTTFIILICFFSCNKKAERSSGYIHITKRKVELHNSKTLSSFDELMKTYKPLKAMINSDKSPDYIFYGIMGQAFFFDGKTKKEISAEIPISKAGPDSELKIIDINCNDNQQEFILQSAGGGTLGNYHSMDVLRYNSRTKKIASIFSYEISSFHWEEDKEILDEVHYIDLLYKKNACTDTIKVYQGKFVDKIESYNLNIKPKKLIEEYYFNKEIEKFEKK